MALYDEDEMRRKKEKDKKLKKYVMIGIISSVIFIIALMVIIFYLIYNPNKITITLDGSNNSKLESMFKYESDDDGNMIIYAPIKDIATVFSYTQGDGTPNYQDENSCYVDSENETVIFTLNSDTIYKKDKTVNSEKTEYENVKINNPVKKMDDGKLYIDQDGMQKAFNVYVSYNAKNKKIEIYTIKTLLDAPTKKATQNNLEIDETFVNTKAILEGMVVVSSKDRLKGIYDRNFTTSISGGLKYDNITYVPQKGVFLVEKDGKVGIIGKDGETKINLDFKSLTLIDNDNDLYLAEAPTTGLFGVIDINYEKTKTPLIWLEYNKIGVDISKYPENNLKSGYVLFKKIIPVQENNQWGFYTIQSRINAEGDKEVRCVKIQNDIRCEDIGCISKTASSKNTAFNLMALEDYNLLVIKQNNHYGFLDVNKGTIPGGIQLADIYMDITSGKTSYYVVTNAGNTINAIETLEKMGYTKKQN